MKNKKLLFSISLVYGILIQLVRNYLNINQNNSFIFYLTAFLIGIVILINLKYLKKKSANYVISYSKNLKKSDKKTKKEENYEFNFSINLSDIQNFQNFIQSQLPTFIRLTSFLSLSLIYFIIFYVSFEAIFEFSLLSSNHKLYSLTILLILSNITSFFYSKQIFKKQFSGITKVGNFKCTLNENGVIRSGLYFNQYYEWQCFESCVRSDEYIYLLFSNFEGLIFPEKDIPENISKEFHSLINDYFA